MPADSPHSSRAHAGGARALLFAVTLVSHGCAKECINGEEANGECILGENGDPCNGGWDCDPASLCWSASCIEEGVLRFSLSWTVLSDLDLHVLTPSGSELSFGNRTADGGYLDVDDCIGNQCRGDGRIHVENIVWNDTPEAGTYEFWVTNYNGGGGGDFEVEVSGARGTDRNTGYLPAQPGAQSTVYRYAL